MQAAAWGFNTDDSEAFRDGGRSLDFRELQLFWGGTISFCCHLGWYQDGYQRLWLDYDLIWASFPSISLRSINDSCYRCGVLFISSEGVANAIRWTLQVKYSRSSLKPHCGRLYSWNVPPDSLSTSVCLWVPGFHQSSSRMWTHASVVFTPLRHCSWGWTCRLRSTSSFNCSCWLSLLTGCKICPGSCHDKTFWSWSVSNWNNNKNRLRLLFLHHVCLTAGDLMMHVHLDLSWNGRFTNPNWASDQAFL